MIQQLVQRLEAALGTGDFASVFAEVANLDREEVNEIASRFVSRTPKSATKKSSLERIQGRHDNLVRLDRLNGWQLGKGAA